MPGALLDVSGILFIARSHIRQAPTLRFLAVRPGAANVGLLCRGCGQGWRAEVISVLVSVPHVLQCRGMLSGNGALWCMVQRTITSVSMMRQCETCLSGRFWAGSGWVRSHCERIVA